MLVDLDRVMAYATALTTPTSPHVVEEEEENNKMRWTTTPKFSTSLDDDTTAFGVDFTATMEATKNTWVLGHTRRHRCVIVVDNWIILSSLRHPYHNITVTLNRWAHFVTMLKDVDNAAWLRPLKHKACGRREVSFRRHVGEGYATAIYRKHILQFRQHYHGEEIRTIYASKEGISINLQDDWNDFLHNIIPSIHRHYLKFANTQPRCGCLYDDEGHHLGWKACTVCYPFGRDIDLKDSDECTYYCMNWCVMFWIQYLQWKKMNDYIRR